MEMATHSGRGRPRAFDPEEALAAALEVFWRRGYEAASLAELTEAMGITKPSLYACFGNKEALFRKALDLYERDKLCYVQSALEAPTSKAVAERLLRGSLAIQTNNTDPKGCLGVISSVGGTAHAECIRDEVIARRASSDRALIERFERARDEGDLPDHIEPQALACYLSAVMQGMAVQASAGVSCDRLETLIETTLSMWPGR
ncbi:TetR/AcrR family transcriptional regulator [Sphingobium sp. BYY-5]|uniref:TetR/AcrR family transcriptional regulator n=1 Tax=Sphingobium sp. BYY-5 TaxID=2926400 RepID=UPI001FA7F5F8|nr:TetR/AcrR family transcriptional regulator [Sphingobium sp. BYY-5]MCI4590438.1 TetR/AcrR family transcriptional regulator [Sphingobium sp. BYY-5]